MLTPLCFSLLLSLVGDPPAEGGSALAPPARGLVPATAALRELAEEAEAAPADERPRASAPAFLGVRLVSEGAKVLVAEVVPGGPADAAGVRAGDRVLAFAGAPVASAEDLAAAVGKRAAGESVRVELIRDGRLLELAIVLGTAPSAPREGASPPEPQAEEAPGWPFPGARGPRIEPFEGWFQWPGNTPPGEPGQRQGTTFFGGRLPFIDPQALEPGIDRLRRDFEEQMEGLRRQLDRDMDELRRDLSGPLGRLRTELAPRLPRALRGSPGGFADVPPEALEDLAQRLAPLEEERRRIVRRWAEDHGRPQWVDSAPSGEWRFEFHRHQVGREDARVRELEREVERLRRRLAERGED